MVRPTRDHSPRRHSSQGHWDTQAPPPRQGVSPSIAFYLYCCKITVHYTCRYLFRRHSGGIRPHCNGKGSKIFPPLSKGCMGLGLSQPYSISPTGRVATDMHFSLAFSEGKTTFGSDKTFLGLGKRFFPWLCIIGQLAGLSVYLDKEHEPLDVIYTQQYFHTKKCK